MSKEKDVRDELNQVTAALRRELTSRKSGDDSSDEQKDAIIAINSDAPVHYHEDDVAQVSDNHFRLRLGGGFGLDLVLLDSSSLAFRSFDGSLLNLKNGTGWPGSLFNPVVGQA